MSSRRNSPPSEAQHLLPSTASADDRKDGEGYVKSLELLPTNTDKLSLFCLLTGAALFLPLTWYITLRHGFSAGWFVGHPPLVSLSILLLLFGIFPLQPPPPSSHVRAKRFNIHQRTMLGLAIPAMAVGVACMYINKHVHSAAHFTTWHSWFGLTTIVWVVLQAAIGAASVWGGGRAFGGEAKAKKVYKWHRASGYAFMTFAFVTAHLGGGHSTWATMQPLAPRIAAFWVGLPLLWLGLVLRLRKSKFQFV